MDSLKFAIERVPTAHLMQMDARRIPYENEFDVIGAFDVLSHIGEDDLVLREMHRAIKPVGGIILTVPQHPWLRSSTDEYACHVRRYSSAQIQSNVKSAGFEIVRTSSFVTLCCRR